MIEIKIESDIVNFYKDNSKSPIYHIRKNELPLTNSESEKESEWINQLITKTWIEVESLYRLAFLIENEFPDNKIDWQETFFPVEKQQYLNHVKATKQITSKKKEYFESIMEDIKTGVEEKNASVDNEIIKIIEKNLKKYGLK